MHTCTKGSELNFSQNISGEDLLGIQSILEQRVRYEGLVLHEEVAEILLAIKDHIDGSGGIIYMVCKSGESVLGVGGMREIPATDTEMRSFATSNNPIEFVNGFVKKRPGVIGVGKGLRDALTQLAQELGYSEIITNSGPRYKRAWKLHDRYSGDRVGIIKDRYGDGYGAQVWRREI